MKIEKNRKDERHEAILEAYEALQSYRTALIMEFESLPKDALRKAEREHCELCLMISNPDRIIAYIKSNIRSPQHRSYQFRLPWLLKRRPAYASEVDTRRDELLTRYEKEQGKYLADLNNANDYIRIGKGKAMLLSLLKPTQ